MKNLNNKKDNTIVKAAVLIVFLSLASFILPSPLLPLSQSADAGETVDIPPERGGSGREFFGTIAPKAPAVVSGENVYIAWWTNNTENGDEEVMFRASSDGGATFTDKINLSNTTEADSWRVEIAGEADTVIVSWWETNQTSDIPVARISTDAGETFGPMLRLAANGTIASTEEGEGEEGETVEEEAAGGAEVAE
jgi:hypothetical protein